MVATFPSPMPSQKAEKRILVAIWVYFGLLIFEGALRKWVLPQLSAPLLVVRDPVVLYMYWQAWQAGVFPRNRWITIIFGLSIAFTLGGLLVPLLTSEGLGGGIPISRSLLIIAYGIRTNFLHLPLIFLMARVLSFQDVIKIGRWILIAGIPIALLMILQFGLPSNHILNVGAGGEEAVQIQAALGRIRPPGPFTFISGPIGYMPLMTAFLLYGLLTPGSFSPMLLISSSLGLGAATVVSISRSLLGSVLIVFFIGLLTTYFNRPQLVKQISKIIVILSIVSFAIILFDTLLSGEESFLDQGLATFQARVTTAGRSEGGFEGFVARFLSGFDPFARIDGSLPLFGFGVGLGTNTGAALVTGQRTFLLGAEGEWDRIVVESGPILGLSFILLRVSLAVWLGMLSFSQIKMGNILSWLLFTTCAINLSIGQFGPPTSLGFAIFSSGLCLSACQGWLKMQYKNSPNT
ncbi:MAG: hypothetical protein NW237_13610 [Cyanobacteriota bacterium]|nr:hypothetical protein [Cyanobacteriota bacterium]